MPRPQFAAQPYHRDRSICMADELWDIVHIICTAHRVWACITREGFSGGSNAEWRIQGNCIFNCLRGGNVVCCGRCLAFRHAEHAFRQSTECARAHGYPIERLVSSQSQQARQLVLRGNSARTESSSILHQGGGGGRCPPQRHCRGRPHRHQYPTTRSFGGGKGDHNFETFRDAMGYRKHKTGNLVSDKEMKSHDELGVYSLVSSSKRLPRMKAIGSRCGYKMTADSTHKRHLVAQGWNRVPGRDCGGTSALVCGFQSTHTVLATATELNWEIYQPDYKWRFLTWTSSRRCPSRWRPVTRPDKAGVPLVIELHKNLDGLTRSPQNWPETIDSYLVIIGFFPLKSDTCVYIYKNGDAIMIFTLYIDDLFLLGRNSSWVIGKNLMSRFRMTDMESVSLVFGMQVTRDREKETGHQPAELHKVCAGVIPHRELQFPGHTRGRYGAITGITGGQDSQRGG